LPHPFYFILFVYERLASNQGSSQKPMPHYFSKVCLKMTQNIMEKQYLEKKFKKFFQKKNFFSKFSPKMTQNIMANQYLNFFFEILPENDPKHHGKAISRKKIEIFFPTARDFGFFWDFEDPALDCPANPKSPI